LPISAQMLGNLFGKTVVGLETHGRVSSGGGSLSMLDNQKNPVRLYNKLQWPLIPPRRIGRSVFRHPDHFMNNPELPTESVENSVCNKGGNRSSPHERGTEVKMMKNYS